MFRKYELRAGGASGPVTANFNFSTFNGRKGVMLDFKDGDISEILALAQSYAQSNDCGRIEWYVERASATTDFEAELARLGASVLRQWVYHRLDRQGVERLAAHSPTRSTENAPTGNSSGGSFSILPARADSGSGVGSSEAGIVLGLIKELAEYEKMSDDVALTEQMLSYALFGEHSAGAYIGRHNGKPIAYALYFYTYDGILGDGKGLYVEDVYVVPAYRGQGLGKQMFAELAENALENGCNRMEWTCLDWNTPSLDFYKGLGAEAMTNLALCRKSL